MLRTRGGNSPITHRAALVRNVALPALLIGLASPLHAQEQAGADPDGDDVQSFRVPEIIVTATKREQTLQDTPVAVSVVSAEEIARAEVQDLLDLQTLVPSLAVRQGQTSGNTTFFIRGFGNGQNAIGLEPSVGVFIDGVYPKPSSAWRPITASQSAPSMPSCGPIGSILAIHPFSMIPRSRRSSMRPITRASRT